MSEFNSCLRSGNVSFGDDFSSVAEVTHLFGSNATKLPYRVWLNVPDKDSTIVCLLSENGGAGWSNVRKIGPVCDERGWNEVLAIDEFNKESETTAARIKEELARPLTRYVFWREARNGSMWYKFYGTFSVDADSTRATLGSENPRVVYRRVSKTAPCLKVETKKTEFSDDEFSALVGKSVKFDLRDELAVVVEDEAKAPGDLAVMPGMKFVVEKTSNQFAHIIGTAGDKLGVRLLVPRRDFELGYLHVLS